MVGCVSDEEKFYREKDAWVKQNLNYENFVLYDAMQSFLYGMVRLESGTIILLLF